MISHVLTFTGYICFSAYAYTFTFPTLGPFQSQEWGRVLVTPPSNTPDWIIAEWGTLTYWIVILCANLFELKIENVKLKMCYLGKYKRKRGLCNSICLGSLGSFKSVQCCRWKGKKINSIVRSL